KASVTTTTTLLTTEAGFRLKGSFAMRWRGLMRGRADERAVAVAPDGRELAGCARWGEAGRRTLTRIRFDQSGKRRSRKSGETRFLKRLAGNEKQIPHR